MIFYFSGTGNSLHVAKGVSSAQKENLASIADEFAKPGTKIEYTFVKGELLGFVFPVYAWGPPKIVLAFIKKMEIKGEIPYTFSISTCGGNEGNTTRLIQKALSKKRLKLDSAFTLRMPGNYVIGVDVKSQDEEGELLKAAEGKMIEINDALSARNTSGYHLIRGKAPAIRTALGNPIFNALALSTRKFYATDSCNRCKLCEKICPVHTITVTDKPSWGKACTQCLACINRCPTHAIQYGKNTIDRGRYVHPDLL
jgi:ferredoxin